MLGGEVRDPRPDLHDVHGSIAATQSVRLMTVKRSGTQATSVSVLGDSLAPRRCKQRRLLTSKTVSKLNVNCKINSTLLRRV